MLLEDIKLIIMDRRSYMLMNLKSLAQGGCAQSKKGKDLVASPHLVNLKKSGIVEGIQAQVVALDFSFDLEYTYAALSRGMQY